MVFAIVLKNLSQAQNGKTIAEKFIDGSITEQELKNLNSTTSFPTNQFNDAKLPEGPYNSQEAMMSFVQTIGPFLSDRRLYEITHQLAEIETSNKNSQAFRNSRLARCFMLYEIERHLNKDATHLPLTFLSHMHTYVLPLFDKTDETPSKKIEEIETDVNMFVDFNLKKVLNPEAALQFQKQDSCYQVISNFNASEFDINKLETKAEKKDIQKELANLHEAYKLMQSKNKNENKDGIASPKFFQKATFFFVKMNEKALQTELQRMHHDLEKYDSNVEIYGAVSSKLNNATDEEHRQYYADLKQKLEQFLADDSERISKIRQAYESAMQKIQDESKLGFRK